MTKIELEKKITELEKDLSTFKKELKEFVDVTIESGDVFKYPNPDAYRAYIIVINTVNNCDQWNIFGLCDKVVPYSNYMKCVSVEEIKSHLIKYKMIKIGNINEGVDLYIRKTFFK